MFLCAAEAHEYVIAEVMMSGLCCLRDSRAYRPDVAESAGI